MTATTVPPGGDRRTTSRTVPHWAVVVAHVAALTPVLSSLWRLPLAFGVSMGMPESFMDELMAEPFVVRAAYLVGLGVFAEVLAFLTIGLVRPWAEVVPRWVPALGGRTIPAWLVVAVASTGGVAATALFTAMSVAWPGNFTGVDGWAVFQTICYAPLVLWGPLVLAATWAYWRRRRA